MSGRKPLTDVPTIYQIYPRSFPDTTGNGEGDLQGIIQKVPYIKSLGVEYVWLSPFYRSPMIDGGYDITDHCAVNPRFGAMDDFEELLAVFHKNGLKVIIDIIFNHTSNQHEWFQKSAENNATYKDYYIWHDPKPDGSVPNNWLTKFGKPAWTWNHKRRQYYLHNFLSEQPNLNLRNPAVQDEVKNILTFWQSKGVDGFRFDAVTFYLSDHQFRDNPAAEEDTREQISGAPNNPYTYQSHKYDVLIEDGVKNA